MKNKKDFEEKESEIIPIKLNEGSFSKDIELGFNKIIVKFKKNKVGVIMDVGIKDIGKNKSYPFFIDSEDQTVIIDFDDIDFYPSNIYINSTIKDNAIVGKLFLVKEKSMDNPKNSPTTETP